MLAETRYARIFSVQEIRDKIVLQWYMGASLFFFFVVFNDWMRSPIATIESAKNGTAVCWPYFQECTRLFFFHGMGAGYSENLFYAGLYGVMIAVVWAMWKKSWNIAHVLMLALFAWEFLVVFVLNYSYNGPYYYYHLFLTSILLFVPFKEYFLKLAFVTFYFASATIKMDDTWVLGTYFTTLKNGLPYIPDALVPLCTNAVILSQIVGCWFLLSKQKILQRSALAFFAFFHLYSALFVSYVFPSTALLPLLVLFGPLYRHTPTPFSPKAIGGWCIIVLIFVFQFLGFSIPERRLTVEGNRFGMYMFDANHQCVMIQTTYRAAKPTYVSTFDTPPGTPCPYLYCGVSSSITATGTEFAQTEVWESGASTYRCDPYEWWVRAQSACKQRDVTRVSLRFDHSVNGGPFYRIVDATDICPLVYKPFVHNEWIKIPPEAPLVGYPVENIYRQY